MNIPARHPALGDCIIRERTNSPGRVKVLVDFPALRIWRQSTYLDELVEPHTGKPVSLQTPAVIPPTPPPQPSPAASWHRARQALLALRLGQSTADTVRELSVGLAEVDEACRWALDRAGGGQLAFLLFVSSYGMGKSHALTHLRCAALARQMAVGTIVLDGVGYSLCQPMSLLSGLAHAIEFPDDRTDEGLPHRLARRVGVGLSITGGERLHDLLRAMPREVVDDPDKWDRIEDYLSLDASSSDLRRELGIRAPTLRAQRRDERPGRCAEIVREWASACSALGAPRGLLVLLDEADVDYAQARHPADAEQRLELLRALRAISEAPPGQGGFARLLIAIAITRHVSTPDPVEELESELGPHLRKVVLRELETDELRELGKRVCDLYGRAYGLSENTRPGMGAMVSAALDAQLRSPEQRNPRKFLRLLLEKLDAAHA